MDPVIRSFSLDPDVRWQAARVLQTLAAKQGALKAAELAKLLAVTRQHIYKLAAAGTLPSFRVGAAVRFDPRAVAEWLLKKPPRAAVVSDGVGARVSVRG
jgi:excisionase family DNA binding protein